MNWIELICIDKEQEKKLIETFTVISNAFKCVSEIGYNLFGQFEYDKLRVIPERTKQMGEIWATYGWVPCLPWFKAVDVMDVISKVNNIDQANKIMQQSIDLHSENELFDVLMGYCEKSGHNIETLRDGISAYEHGLYTACTLCVFSIIDSCFVYGQPKEDKNRRCLPQKAVRRSVNIDYYEYLVIPYSMVEIIETIYKNAKDFSIKEDMLYRNYISHGMNKYIPDRIDCLKLFTLLYNIYELFEAEILAWKSDKKRENNRKEHKQNDKQRTHQDQRRKKHDQGIIKNNTPDEG